MNSNSPVDYSSALDALLQSEPVILTMSELRTPEDAATAFAESTVRANL